MHWGNSAIGPGFRAQSRGLGFPSRHGSGVLQPWSVRYASTEAGLHFVEGEAGDTAVVQANVADAVSNAEAAAAAASSSGLGEVAAAAADCSAPTAALQHLIDFVHTQGGLPWYV